MSSIVIVETTSIIWWNYYLYTHNPCFFLEKWAGGVGSQTMFSKYRTLNASSLYKKSRWLIKCRKVFQPFIFIEFPIHSIKWTYIFECTGDGANTKYTKNMTRVWKSANSIKSFERSRRFSMWKKNSHYFSFKKRIFSLIRGIRDSGTFHFPPPSNFSTGNRDFETRKFHFSSGYAPKSNLSSSAVRKTSI